MKKITKRELRELIKEEIKSLKESKPFKYYMQKQKVDDEYVRWLSNEFDLNPETIWTITDISSDPEEVYNILNKKVDKEGYGFDKVSNNNNLVSYAYLLSISSLDMDRLISRDVKVDSRRFIEKIFDIVSNKFHNISKTGYITSKDALNYIISYFEEDGKGIFSKKEAERELKNVVKNLPDYIKKQYGDRINYNEWKELIRNNIYLVKAEGDESDFAEYEFVKKVKIR